MPDAPDPYKVLQVDPEAEDEVIQAAYRRLARKYHPDLAETAEAASRMAAINAAWERIGEPAARTAYDAERAADRRAAGRGRDSFDPAAPRGSGLPQRPSAASRPATPPPPAKPREPEATSADWTSGRSSVGGGYDESMRRPRVTGPPVRRRAGRPGRCSTSVATPAGRSARSPATTSSTSNGWIGRRSGATTARRSMRSCGRPDAASPWRPTPPIGAGSTAAARGLPSRAPARAW